MKETEDKPTEKPMQPKRKMSLGSGKTKFKNMETFKVNQVETYVKASTAEGVAELSKIAEESKPQSDLEMAVLTDEAEAERVANFELNQVRTMLEQTQQQSQTTPKNFFQIERYFNFQGGSKKELANLGISSNKENLPKAASAKNLKNPWNFPDDLYKEKLYVNREIQDRELKRLFAAKSPRSAQLLVSIYGLGGIGKTSAALNFMAKYETNYSKCFWFDFEKIAQEYKTLGAAIGYEDITDQELKPTIINWLSNQIGCLIVYDNVPDYSYLKPWLPKGKGHVLITSRDETFWPELNHQILWGQMNEKEACQLLFNRAGRLDPDFPRLAQTLGGLALALAQAGAYMGEKKRTCTAADYIDLFKTEKKALLGRNDLKGSHKSVLATLSINLNEVKFPAADKLLKYIACLHNNAIPLQLLQYLLYGENFTAKEVLEFNEAISQFFKFSIVSVDGENDNRSLSVHALVQEIYFESTSLLQIISKVVKFYSLETFNQKTIVKKSLIPHFIKIAENLEQITDEKSAYLREIIELYLILAKFYMEGYQLMPMERCIAKGAAYAKDFFKQLIFQKKFYLIEINLLYYQVNLNLLQGNHEEACKLAEKMMQMIATRTEIKSISSYILLYVECLKKMGKYEEAIKQCQTFKENDKYYYKARWQMADIFFSMDKEIYYDYYQQALEHLNQLLKEPTSEQKVLSLEKAKIFIELGERIEGLTTRDNWELYKEANAYLKQAKIIYTSSARNSTESNIHTALTLVHQAELDHDIKLVRQFDKSKKKSGVLFSVIWGLKYAWTCLDLLFNTRYKKLGKAFAIMKDEYSNDPHLNLSKIAYISVLNHYAMADLAISRLIPESRFKFKKDYLDSSFNYFQQVSDILDKKLATLLRPSSNTASATPRIISLTSLKTQFKNILGTISLDPFYTLRHFDNLAIYFVERNDYDAAIKCYYLSLLTCKANLNLSSRALRPICGIILLFVKQNIINDRIRDLWRIVKPHALEKGLHKQFEYVYNQIVDKLEPASEVHTTKFTSNLLIAFFICILSYLSLTAGSVFSLSSFLLASLSIAVCYKTYQNLNQKKLESVQTNKPVSALYNETSYQQLFDEIEAFLPSLDISSSKSSQQIIDKLSQSHLVENKIKSDKHDIDDVQKSPEVKQRLAKDNLAPVLSGGKEDENEDEEFTHQTQHFRP